MIDERDLKVDSNVWVIPGFSEEALLAIKCKILSVVGDMAELDEPLGHMVKNTNLFLTKTEVKKELYSRWVALRNEDKESANKSIITTIKSFRDYYIGQLAVQRERDVEEYRAKEWEELLNYKRRKKEWFNVRDLKLERKAKGIMTSYQYEKLSKYIALLLRHKPEVGNIKLDEMGACLVEDLLNAVKKQMRFHVTRKNIERLARPPKDPSLKQRYIIEGDYIRAGHGHSIEVSGYQEVTPTEELYHGTPSYIVEKIEQTSLNRMSRDKVHLSTDKEITLEAARRRSRHVTLLRVNLELAMQAGVKFYKSADSRIILSDDIDPTCLEKLENEAWIPVKQPEVSE